MGRKHLPTHLRSQYDQTFRLQHLEVNHIPLLGHNPVDATLLSLLSLLSVIRWRAICPEAEAGPSLAGRYRPKRPEEQEAFWLDGRSRSQVTFRYPPFLSLVAQIPSEGLKDSKHIHTYEQQLMASCPFGNP